MPVLRAVDGLRPAIQACLRVGLPVVVVQGGRHAAATQLLADLPVTSHHQPHISGRGGAILSGLSVARQAGASHVVVVDPDRRYLSGHIAAVAKALEQTPDDIIVTLPHGDHAHPTTLSRCKRAYANFWLRIQTGLRLGDTTSPLRGYPLTVLSNLTLKEKGGAFDAEVLVKSLWAGVSVREVPISGVQRRYDAASFPERPLREGFRLVLLNIHLAMRSITPIPHRKIDSRKAVPEKKISVLRPLASLKRLLTENMEPGQLGLAVAMGVFLGTLPLIALHSVAILFGANFFRLNKVVALSASQLCMPPIVPALCVEAGYFLRHGAFLTEISLETLGYQALDRILEWFVGAVLLAPLLAVLLGGITYLLSLYLLKTKLRGNDTLVAARNPRKER